MVTLLRSSFSGSFYFPLLFFCSSCRRLAWYLGIGQTQYYFGMHPKGLKTNWYTAPVVFSTDKTIFIEVEDSLSFMSCALFLLKFLLLLGTGY
jgi:hypothetical protein